MIDAELQPVPDGSTGEIVIRGPNVMLGYYKNDEATRASFTPDGWLRTGDLGHRDADGFFFVTGRIKELIIKGGENIAPREIDEALLQHPAVLEAAAVGMPDKHYGQEIMACVVLRDGHAADEAELRAFCEQHLGRYKTPKRLPLRRRAAARSVGQGAAAEAAGRRRALTLLGWPLPVLLAGLLVSLGAGCRARFRRLRLLGADGRRPGRLRRAGHRGAGGAGAGDRRQRQHVAQRDARGRPRLAARAADRQRAVHPDRHRAAGGAAGDAAAPARGQRAAGHGASRCGWPAPTRFAPTPALRAGAGISSGLLNGVAASGGVAAAMLMAAARVPAGRLRATMVSFLLFAGAYALVCAALMPTAQGTSLLSIDTLRWAALLAPTMLAGIWLGKHSFANADPTGYRQHVLTLLIVISALGVLRAGFDLISA